MSAMECAIPPPTDLQVCAWISVEDSRSAAAKVPEVRQKNTPVCGQLDKLEHRMEVIVPE
jgi:hypothetical protein